MTHGFVYYVSVCLCGIGSFVFITLKSVFILEFKDIFSYLVLPILVISIVFKLWKFDSVVT